MLAVVTVVELVKDCGFKYQALYSYKLRFHFSTPAGILEYLNGQTFEAKQIWFLDDFYRWPD